MFKPKEMKKELDESNGAFEICAAPESKDDDLKKPPGEIDPSDNKNGSEKSLDKEKELGKNKSEIPEDPDVNSQGIRVNEQPQKEVTPNEEGAKQLDEQKETINEAIEKLKAQEKQANEESDREKLKLTKIIDSQRQSIETLTRKLKDAGLANDKLKREKAELAKTLSIREKKIKKLTCELEEAIEAQEEKDEEIEVQK